MNRLLVTCSLRGVGARTSVVRVTPFLVWLALTVSTNALAQDDARGHAPGPLAPCNLLLTGSVADSATARAIPQASIRAEDSSGRVHTALADPNGRFEIPSLCPGALVLEVSHVGYRTRTLRTETSSVAGERRNTLRVDLELPARIYTPAEVDVRAETVLPLVSVERASRILPTSPIDAFAMQGLAEVIALVPGVLVSGDRLFFRGVGAEHISTVVDGVLAREPITGRWILPPPQAIDGAEIIASTMVSENAPSLGGVLAIHLAEGAGERRSRLVYGSDRLESGQGRRTDSVTLTSSGSTAIPHLTYAISYRGSMSDGAYAFDRALPEQAFLGAAELGHRMNGEESFAFKGTWRVQAPDSSAWKTSAAVLSERSRQKAFHGHYERSGWVGYVPQADRYTHFLEEPPVPGRDVYYAGPEHVPVESNRSTLVMAKLARAFAGGGYLEGHLSYGDHASDTEHAGREIEDTAALDTWLREETTSSNHQEETFSAVHGDLPSFVWSRSREGGAGLAGSWRMKRQHHLRFGASVTHGRYRHVTALPAPIWWFGSFETPLEVTEGHAYLEETWHSDRRSWVRVALTQVFRSVDWRDAGTTAGRLAPAIAFHQPMSTTDALHVEAGQTYQFPALETHFPPRFAIDPTPAVVAQRVRFAEIGLQHHFSPRLVGYLGGHERVYTDVIFAARAPTAAEELTGAPGLTPTSLESRSLEIAFDFQIRSSWSGQTSFSWSRIEAEDVAGEDREVPWSRRAFWRNWLVWRGPRGFSATLSSSWDSGRPYDLCLLGRDCASWQRIDGTLPGRFASNLAAAWKTRLGGREIELSIQIDNVLGQRDPEYAFSVFPMAISSDHFLAYWDATGSTGGYLTDNGAERFSHVVNNPETRTPGRAILLAAGITF